MDIILWLDSLIYPHDTFTAERDHAYFSKALKNILLSGSIYACITAILYIIFPSISGNIFAEIIRKISGEYFALALIIFFPLIFTLIFLFLSLLLYISARIFNGYGDFTTQSYLLSILISILILFDLLDFIPKVGFFMVSIVLLYSFRAIITLLKITHLYDTKKALCTVALSFIFFIIFLFSLLIILWQSGIFVFFNYETKVNGFKYIIIPEDNIIYRYDSIEFTIINTLPKSVVLSSLKPYGDCSNGFPDLDKNTEKFESFVVLNKDESTDVKIYNCSKKYLPRGRFYVPFRIIYQEKEIGESTTHLESGIIEGLTS